ncbi:MFS transporter [Pseudonocardia bannensis]|uniref:MFS transporter n=1 Tax=Pseudonocardia bannensis TaxID=630973 RepID=A0A848DGE0_9PSEU|nr:MFS transporter [Pseudonocardia bannensis]NMH91707.1 MFS transporter [Pseudonocardia bannensis]
MTEPTAAGTVSGETAAAARESVWAPLRVRAFRMLWFAQLGSMLGTWMQTVGAQWMLVDEPSAETLVAMVQVAAMLPMLLLALPAGALADIMDRRRLLIGVQTFQVCVGVGLTALTLADRMPPALLLIFTFLLGSCMALTLPAYQALVQELVPREQVPSAAALAGLVIAQVGAAAVFAINAAAAVAFALVLTAGRHPVGDRGALPERFTSAMRAGQRYVRNSPVVRRMLLRVVLFVLPGAAMWALLPLVASRLLGAGAAGYGLLLGALGAGAVLGADLMPRLSSRLSSNGLMLASGLAYAASLLACVLVDSLALLAVLLVPAGIAWLAVLMGVTGALQVFLPGWVRARGLSMFNIVFAFGQAGGALAWGLVARWFGLVPAFVSAAVLMAVGALTVLVWPLRDVTGWNRDPAVYWPEPDLAQEADPEVGPVVVTITYTVDEANVPAFLQAMEQVRRSRLRTGASSCELYRDGSDPARFVQVAHYRTWGEHLRQHADRLTGTDQARDAAADALAAAPPVVAHLFPTR